MDAGNNNTSKLKILDHALLSLSPEEQEQAILELYGSKESMEETDEFIDGKLNELYKEIAKLNEANKRFYVHALAMEKQQDLEAYFSSRQFLLMFLRADRFVSHKAALRISEYFRWKMDLFGRDKSGRKIRLSDLYKSDQEALRGGLFCSFNSYDSAGRLLIFMRRRDLVLHDVTSSMRAIFYIMQNIMENNESAQKNGAIFIGYNLGLQAAVQLGYLRNFVPISKMLFGVLPCRIAAHHMCYNDIKDSIKANIIAVTYPKEFRSKLHRHHVKTHQELMQLLQSFGIDPNLVPFTEDGVCLREGVYKWIEKQRELEKDSK